MAPKKGGTSVKWTGESYKSGGKGMFGFTGDQQAAAIAGITGTKPATNAYKRVANDQSAAESQFGGSLRASIRKQFVGARATAQAAAVIADVKQGELQQSKQTIGDIATIFKGGMQAQAMAAAAAKARAVQAATGASDSQTAAFAMELAKMKYAAQLQAQATAKAANAAQKEAEAQYGVTMAPQMQALQTQTPSIASSVAGVVNSALAAAEGKDAVGAAEGNLYSSLSVTQLQAQWMEQSGYTPNEDGSMSAQAQLGTALIQQMVNGKQGVKDAFEGAMSTVYAGAPGYEKWGAPTAQAIITSMQAGEVDRVINSPNAPVNTGGDYGDLNPVRAVGTALGGDLEGSTGWRDLFGFMPGLFG